jgi:hypothetical protein
VRTLDSTHPTHLATRCASASAAALGANSACTAASCADSSATCGSNAPTPFQREACTQTCTTQTPPHSNLPRTGYLGLLRVVGVLQRAGHLLLLQALVCGGGVSKHRVHTHAQSYRHTTRTQRTLTHSALSSMFFCS